MYTHRVKIDGELLRYVEPCSCRLSCSGSVFAKEDGKKIILYSYMFEKIEQKETIKRRLANRF